MRIESLLIASVFTVFTVFTPSCGSDNGSSSGGTGGVAAAGGTGGKTDAGVCTPGTERCPCYGNGTCNQGLTCASQVCVNVSGSGGAGGATGGSGGAGGSGATGGSSGTTDSGLTTDSGSGGATDSGALSFDVKSMPGLVLWLDAAVGVTKDVNNLVSLWADQSGKGDDLTPSATAPTYLPAGLNGGPAIGFSAPANGATATNTNMTFAGDFLVEYVAIEPSTSTEYTAFGLVPLANALSFNILNNGGCDLLVAEGLAAVADVACSKTGLAGTTPHLFGFRRTSSDSNFTFEVRIDGAADGSASILVGLSFQGVELDNGSIAEVVAVNGPTSTSDLAAVEAYLKAKHGI